MSSALLQLGSDTALGSTPFILPCTHAPRVGAGCVAALLQWRQLCNHALCASAGTECAALIAQLNAAVADLNLYDILEPCYTGHQASTDQERPAQASSQRRALLQVPDFSLEWDAYARPPGTF